MSSKNMSKLRTSRAAQMMTEKRIGVKERVDKMTSSERTRVRVGMVLSTNSRSKMGRTRRLEMSETSDKSNLSSTARKWRERHWRR
jgi:hypothetical protein